jgi:hypothetical protein
VICVLRVVMVGNAADEPGHKPAIRHIHTCDDGIG